MRQECCLASLRPHLCQSAPLTCVSAGSGVSSENPGARNRGDRSCGGSQDVPAKESSTTTASWTPIGQHALCSASHWSIIKHYARGIPGNHVMGVFLIEHK